MKKHFQVTVPIAALMMALAISTGSAAAQPDSITINLGETHQTMEGFGASLAYYENWLIAHPKKAEIYEAIFGELSLDILRVRNAYDYDSGMIERVAEFAQAAESSLGKPISILSSSWGPPGYLKSNNDRHNGGTLKFTGDGSGVEFDYAGFAGWWNRSLDEYNSHGIFPAYISIQNEPDWAASWETCLLKPAETVNASDTIAGYDKALDAVYDTLLKREQMPKILGPECSGIGFNSVENYVNALDVSKLYGIAHHLYNGVDPDDPWSSSNFAKVGGYHPEIPHFQTEYYQGDWFSLAGLIYKSLHDENAVAYLYWDLIWDGSGLVSLDFPWDPARWTDPQKGYTKTKDFYAFKQFSGFIHPDWHRTGADITNNNGRLVAFASQDLDSASLVIINRAENDSLLVHVGIPGYFISESSVYVTSATENTDYKGGLGDSLLVIPPSSILTVAMDIAKITTGSPSLNMGSADQHIIIRSLYPNPFSDYAMLEFTLKNRQSIRLGIFDALGQKIGSRSLGMLLEGNHSIRLDRDGLNAGMYLYRLENNSGKCKTGRFIIR